MALYLGSVNSLDCASGLEIEFNDTSLRGND